MASGDIIMLSQKELIRLHIVHKILNKELNHKDASKALSLSERQIRRIVSRVTLEGDHGIVHKSRGKSSNRRISQRIKNKVIERYRTRYSGFGPTFAAEKLFERDKIKVHQETLRKWLIEAGDWKRMRKSRAHRQWRERKPHIGEMVQVDGSHHDWFEQRGSKCVFMGYIDDATGITFGRFYPYEGTFPAMDSFKRYIKKYGIPMSLYLDKHSTYKSTAKPSIDEMLSNSKPLSEFERAMKEFGVKVIHADSPQAKGRVERLFRTLQDRLIKEMRLEKISTIEDANKFLARYLPEHNKKFAVKPTKQSDLHREIPKGTTLDRILCRKTQRVLRNDMTVEYNNKLYQIKDKVNTRKIVIEERISGTKLMTHRNTILKFKEITLGANKQQEPTHNGCKKSQRYLPPVDHPWNNVKYG
ncbi:MAG: ISNCY family transposase [Candidatus Brocadiaceae bacterium]|nr:ISNCY family transposase [Candidatus Brocadiaceae bacterium]